jgi:hypothetical protein
MNFQKKNFQEKLDTYATLLIVHGLNVQPGQSVNITAEIVHRNLVEKMVKAAYKRGAKYVNVDFIDPQLQRLRVEESQEESYLQHVPRYMPSFAFVAAKILMRSPNFPRSESMMCRAICDERSEPITLRALANPKCSGRSRREQPPLGPKKSFLSSMRRPL